MKAQIASVVAQADGGWFDFLPALSGPDFLLLYFVWFVVMYGTVLLFRWSGKDTPMVTLCGIAGYELLGVLRIIIGSLYGKENWGFLILMMVIGGIIFLLRASHLQSNGDGGGWWNSSCSGGSGCGGCGGS